MNFIVYVIKVIAFVMLSMGAIASLNLENKDAADIMLICLAMSVFADLLKGIGDTFGPNSKTKPTLPGSSNL